MLINSEDANKDDYHEDKRGQRRPAFKFNYWMPQVDVNDNETDFYDLSLSDKYLKL